MADLLDLSIIIPTYNEALAIGDAVRGILALELSNIEVLVIDDGSNDGTGDRAREAGATVLSHPYNIGNGAAVKTGIRNARGAVLVFMDGDGQHDPQDIPRLVAEIGRYHMVVGARQRGSHASTHRALANGVYNSFASFIADFDIQDLTSGFRAIRAIDARRFCDMLPNGFSSPTTLTLAFIRSGRSLCYIPIQAKSRLGKSKIRLLSDGFEFLVIILKIVMTFSPLRVFLPVSSFLFFLGIGRYVYTYLFFREFTNMSHLLINSSIIIFMLGLIAEQVSQLRLEKGDELFSPEDEERLGRVVKNLRRAVS